MNDPLLLLALLAAATARGAAPLVLAALGGLFAERSGIVDIGLEGKMLASAFAAAATAAVTGSAWMGLVAGIAAAVLVGLVHGFACITHHGNQVVSGHGAQHHDLGADRGARLRVVPRGRPDPAARRRRALRADRAARRRGARRDPRASGTIYREVLSGHNLLVYIAAVAVPAVAWIVYRTRFGLRLRAVGESPGAVDTAGISVAAMRYRALVVSGVLCGLSGAYLSIAHHASFIRDMSAGKGYLALAALIFGQWRPVPTLAACLLFAFADAVQARLQGTPLPLVGVVPVQLDPGHSLRADGAAAGRLRRTRRGAPGDRGALREGTMSPSPSSPCSTSRGRRSPTRTRRTRASGSAPASAPASGQLYAGCNVENASYPVTQCAEATAIGAMVAAGERQIVEVVIVYGRRRAVSAVRPLPPAARRVRAARRRASISAGPRVCGSPRRSASSCRMAFGPKTLNRPT